MSTLHAFFQEAGKIYGLISKVHFIVRKTKDGIVIEDKSSNGTSVNGQEPI
jgi:predicted component of type VI protein secretion system